MRKRGITLVELLLALTIATLVMMAAGQAYLVGARTAKTLGNGRDVVARRTAFERQLTDLFEHVYLDADTTDLNTYFMSGDALATKSAASSGTTTTGSSSTSSSSSSGSGGTGDNSTIVFTVLGRRLPSTVLTSPNDNPSSESDFETNNQTFGPMGGVTEIELSTSPVGQPSAGQTGLFIRQQAPADSDATQGGRESLFSADVDTISFQFYDGTQWETTWDTTTMTPRRLPSAVQVTYRLKGDTQDRILVFSVPSSDVTPDNPVTETTT